MFLKDKGHKLSGFSLVEMLLTMGLLVSLTGLSMTIYMSYLDQNKLDSARSTVVQALTAAQTNAAAAVGDSEWGVRVNTANVILFKGSSYATRDATQDFTYTYSTTVSLSGPTEVVFSRVYAVPATTGTITLSLFGKSEAIQLNSKAIFNY